MPFRHKPSQPYTVFPAKVCRPGPVAVRWNCTNSMSWGIAAKRVRRRVCEDSQAPRQRRRSRVWVWVPGLSWVWVSGVQEQDNEAFNVDSLQPRNSLCGLGDLKPTLGRAGERRRSGARCELGGGGEKQLPSTGDSERIARVVPATGRHSFVRCNR